MSSRAAHVLAILATLLSAAFAAPPALGAFPGENGKIVFISREPPFSDDYGIFTVEPDGSAFTRLTHEPPVVLNGMSPTWSADGRKIAFARPTAGSWDIWTMNADGSGQQQLTSAPGRSANHDPTWSPDGQRIAFGGVGGIWVMNSDGTGQTNITADLQMTETEPAWSPDGARIAFTGTGESSDVWTIAPDGSNPVNITNTPSPAHETEPAWSPDGSRLAYFLRQTSRFEIHVSAADGENRSFVTNGGRPAWSPDGTRIAFDDPFGVSTVNPDGSQPAFVRAGSFPDWQPIPRAPQRDDFRNAAAFCAAEREFYGEPEFARRHGTNPNGANAFGKCVSRNR